MTTPRGHRGSPAADLAAKWWAKGLITVVLTAVLIVVLAQCGAPPGPGHTGWPMVSPSGQRLTLVAASQSGEHRAARRYIWASESGTDAVAGVVDVASDFGDGSGLAGTAIVIGDGYLVTAAHLVRSRSRTGQDGVAGRVWVSDPGGFWAYPAWVVGVDDSLDLAVLWVSGAALQPAAIGDSRTVREGDELRVVGNAHGWGPLRGATGAVLDTEAVIASTAPAIGAGSSGATSGSLSGMIEIQAGVVAGDSGGAVLNSRGQVVAMVLGYVPTAGSDAVPDQGYAMPVNRVMHAANQLTTVSRGAGHRCGCPVR